jgi:hypothetical protein
MDPELPQFSTPSGQVLYQRCPGKHCHLDPLRVCVAKRGWAARAFAFNAAAQEATIGGTVTDPSGAASPGVQITGTNNESIHPCINCPASLPALR